MFSQQPKVSNDDLRRGIPGVPHDLRHGPLREKTAQKHGKDIEEHLMTVRGALPVKVVRGVPNTSGSFGQKRCADCECCEPNFLALSLKIAAFGSTRNSQLATHPTK